MLRAELAVADARLGAVENALALREKTAPKNKPLVASGGFYDSRVVNLKNIRGRKPDEGGMGGSTIAGKAIG
jgi:hypothetical protein